MVLVSMCNIENTNDFYISNNESIDKFLYSTIKDFENSINLTSMRQVDHEVEIRIWVLSNANPDQLIILKSSNNEWMSFYYLIWSNLNHNLIKSYVDSFYAFKLEPTTKWSLFIDKLEAKKLFALKKQNYEVIDKIYKTLYGGVMYCIETNIKGRYKISYFPCPDIFTSEINDSKNIIEILTLLKEEFKLSNYILQNCQ